MKKQLLPLLMIACTIPTVVLSMDSHKDLCRISGGFEELIDKKHLTEYVTTYSKKNQLTPTEQDELEAKVISWTVEGAKKFKSIVCNTAKFKNQPEYEEHLRDTVYFLNYLSDYKMPDFLLDDPDGYWRTYFTNYSESCPKAKTTFPHAPNHYQFKIQSLSDKLPWLYMGYRYLFIIPLQKKLFVRIEDSGRKTSFTHLLNGLLSRTETEKPGKVHVPHTIMQEFMSLIKNGETSNTTATYHMHEIVAALKQLKTEKALDLLQTIEQRYSYPELRCGDENYIIYKDLQKLIVDFYTNEKLDSKQKETFRLCLTDLHKLKELIYEYIHKKTITSQIIRNQVDAILNASYNQQLTTLSEDNHSYLNNVLTILACFKSSQRYTNYYIINKRFLESSQHEEIFAELTTELGKKAIDKICKSLQLTQKQEVLCDSSIYPSTHEDERIINDHFEIDQELSQEIHNSKRENLQQKPPLPKNPSPSMSSSKSNKTPDTPDTINTKEQKVKKK